MTAGVGLGLEFAGLDDLCGVSAQSNSDYGSSGLKPHHLGTWNLLEQHALSLT